jgi:hypothetical protein
MIPTAQLRQIEQALGADPQVGKPEAPTRLRNCKPSSPGDALQAVLTIRACVQPEEVPSFVRGALQEIRAYIKAHQLEVEGPPFTICHRAPPHGLDVEAGWPVLRAAGKGRIHGGALPYGLVRSGRDQTR